MYEGSYVGATQMLAAIAHSPHLAGICPVVTASNYHDGWTYQGGAFLPLSRWRTPSVLPNHRLGSLDDGLHRVPLLQVQPSALPTRDCTLNQVFADTHTLKKQKKAAVIYNTSVLGCPARTDRGVPLRQGGVALVCALAALQTGRNFGQRTGDRATAGPDRINEQRREPQRDAFARVHRRDRQSPRYGCARDSCETRSQCATTLALMKVHL